MAAPGTGGKVVAPPRGAPEALLAHRRDPDRRSGLLHGRRRHAHIGEVVIFAVMAEFLARKASLDDGQPFEHAAEALAEWHPEGVEFLGRRPDPDRQIDARARNVVEYREVPQRYAPGCAAATAARKCQCGCAECAPPPPPRTEPATGSTRRARNGARSPIPRRSRALRPGPPLRGSRRRSRASAAGCPAACEFPC